MHIHVLTQICTSNIKKTLVQSYGYEKMIYFFEWMKFPSLFGTFAGQLKITLHLMWQRFACCTQKV